MTYSPKHRADVPVDWFNPAVHCCQSCIEAYSILIAKHRAEVAA